MPVVMAHFISTFRIIGKTAPSYLSVAILALAGCSILTKSQVAEVSKFAKAANSYTALPGAVLKAEADMWEARELLDVSITTSDHGWDAITRARSQSDRLYSDAERVDSALGILKIYGEQLTLLVSDKPVTDLDKSAEDLGKSLDGAIALYNKSYGTTFSSIGGWAAAGISAAGRLYIRHKQQVLLRQYVDQAQPMIEKLNKDTTRFTDVIIEQIKSQEEDLHSSYKNVADTFKGAGGIPVSTVQSVRDAYREGQQALKLAPICKKAANDYSAAHAKLRQAISEKRNLTGAIEEIEALEQELEAANKVRENLSKKK